MPADGKERAEQSLRQTARVDDTDIPDSWLKRLPEGRRSMFAARFAQMLGLMQRLNRLEKVGTLEHSILDAEDQASFTSMLTGAAAIYREQIEILSQLATVHESMVEILEQD